MVSTKGKCDGTDQLVYTEHETGDWAGDEKGGHGESQKSSLFKDRQKLKYQY